MNGLFSYYLFLIISSQFFLTIFFSFSFEHKDELVLKIQKKETYKNFVFLKLFRWKIMINKKVKHFLDCNINLNMKSLYWSQTPKSRARRAASTRATRKAIDEEYSLVSIKQAVPKEPNHFEMSPEM